MSEGQNIIALEVTAIDRAPVKLNASEVEVPGTEGPFTVLPGHAPLVATIDIGVLTAKMPEGGQHTFALGGGFARVLDNHVLILAQSAEIDTEIDAARAKAAKERAEERLREQKDTVDVTRAEMAFTRALTRLTAVAGKSFQPTPPAEDR